MKVRPVGRVIETAFRKTLSLHSCPEGVRWPAMGEGFLFLPAQNGSNGNYWSSTENDSNNAWNFNFNSSGGHNMNNDNRTNEYAVRPFQD